MLGGVAARLHDSWLLLSRHAGIPVSCRTRPKKGLRPEWSLPAQRKGRFLALPFESLVSPCCCLKKFVVQGNSTLSSKHSYFVFVLFLWVCLDSSCLLSSHKLECEVVATHKWKSVMHYHTPAYVKVWHCVFSDRPYKNNINWWDVRLQGRRLVVHITFR